MNKNIKKHKKLIILFLLLAVFFGYFVYIQVVKKRDSYNQWEVISKHGTEIRIIEVGEVNPLSFYSMLNTNYKNNDINNLFDILHEHYWINGSPEETVKEIKEMGRRVQEENEKRSYAMRNLLYFYMDNFKKNDYEKYFFVKIFIQNDYKKDKDLKIEKPQFVLLDGEKFYSIFEISKAGENYYFDSNIFHNLYFSNDLILKAGERVQFLLFFKAEDLNEPYLEVNLSPGKQPIKIKLDKI